MSEGRAQHCRPLVGVAAACAVVTTKDESMRILMMLGFHPNMKIDAVDFAFDSTHFTCGYAFVPWQWDKSDKKVAVVGYSIATLVGLYVIESIAHLPVLNVVRGGPLQSAYIPRDRFHHRM